MGKENREKFFTLPLPVVRRATIDKVLSSISEYDLVKAKHSKIPLFSWLGEHSMAFFFGGALCRYALEQEAIANQRKLPKVTQKTMNEFIEEIRRREQKLFELNIEDMHEVPAELAPSFSVWKPENPELMDFLATEMPRRLAGGGYTAMEIGSAQAGALLTYEISRMQALG